MAAAKPTINAHLPKVEIITKHKVIRFGTTRKTESDEEAERSPATKSCATRVLESYAWEAKLYSYLHQRADLKACSIAKRCKDTL